METVIPPQPQAYLPVRGTSAVFPVHRIYCVGRNYAEHAQEMGFTGREPPFFFMKPADAVVASGATIPWPPRTDNLHHEVELVAVADPELLRQTAKQLQLPLDLKEFVAGSSRTSAAGELSVAPVSLRQSAEAGRLNRDNAAYVLDTLAVGEIGHADFDDDQHLPAARRRGRPLRQHVC